MCDKLKEIHGLSPSQLLLKCWQAPEYPVDMKKVLDSLRIPFGSLDFSQLERSLHLKRDNCILGMAFSQENDLRIITSDKLDSQTANYVLAHELAHCCLHMEPTSAFHVELKTSYDIYSDLIHTPIKEIRGGDLEKEVAADIFAARILLPANFSCSAEEIPKYMEEYRVSEDIIQLKIQADNLKYRVRS